MEIRILLTGTKRGFFSHVFQVVTHYSLNDGNLYYPYFVDSLYSNIPNHNMWLYYFEEPFKIDQSSSYVASDWFTEYNIPQNISNDYCIKINDIMKKYIILKPEIKNMFNNIKNRMPSEYLSVHKRGTDHDLHGIKLGIEDYFNEIDMVVDAYEYIYLATDEENTVVKFKNRYGNRLIYNDFIRSEDDTNAIHFSKGLENPYRMGLEVLMDSLILSNSSEMLCTWSGVSQYAILNNPNLKYKRIDPNIIYK